MNKRKLARNVSLVALSAVMVCGTAAAFAGCGGKDKTYTLTVNIFCNDSDAATNRKICDDWAARYTEQLKQSGEIKDDETKVNVDFQYDSNQENYFQALDRAFSGGNAADIIYLSPKYVKAWSAQGRVLDISGFIDASNKEQVAQINGIWEDSLGLYGFAGEKGQPASGYQLGDRIHYYTSGEQVNGQAVTEPGFYTSSGIKTGLYGLPKDYSNFGMAYNAKFFTEDLKKEMTTKKATTEREVKGARGNTAKLTFTGDDAGVITYDVSGTYTNPYTGQQMTATIGEDAPIINIGVPTRYKPYNYYRFANYKAAVDGGDPIALSVELWSPDIDGDENGDGYVVTIPGFPGETFDLDEAEWDGEKVTVDVDENAIYDNSIGHITYTYQEFGALTWAICYYYNTFNWNCKNAAGDPQPFKAEDTLKGTGGMKQSSGVFTNVYGNDQYEGAPGPTLYLLPWLYGNDADFIDSSSTKAAAGDDITPKALSDKVPSYTTIAAMREAYLSTGEEQERMNLDGTTSNRLIQYGANTQNFIETYGAFLEYGSTWNGNCGNCGDENTTKSDNGWAFFRGGAEVFYGSGTWDSATRNQSDFREGEEGLCEFRMMPQAVGEKYALYSSVKDGFYEPQYYIWDNASKTATKYEGSYSNYGSTVESKAPAEPFTMGEVYANQIVRQDKWGARMDSVGFAANRELEKKTGDEAWKVEGAVSLIMALSIDETAQVTLTYAGAQIPNFKQQCIDFLHYQDEGYENGTFKDMITPEGSATVKGEAGRELWNAYYEVAFAMDQASRNVGDYRGMQGKTVGEFIASYNNGKVTYGGADHEIQYDPQYKDVQLGKFPNGDISNRGYAMAILRMTTFTYDDRDINLRMQYGLNSARDSAMYTYNVAWINLIEMRSGDNLAYNLATPVKGKEGKTAKDTLKALVNLYSANQRDADGYETAAAKLLRIISNVQAQLNQAIALENAAINSAK